MPLNWERRLIFQIRIDPGFDLHSPVIRGIEADSDRFRFFPADHSAHVDARQGHEREGDFNFSCRFASRTNPRVIHRFEAEASDPLEAVNQVLRQLDDWRARHLDRNQGAHTASAESRPTPRAPESTEVEITNRAF